MKSWLPADCSAVWLRENTNNVLDKNTQYLTELNDDVQSNINNLNIQKDNKKRIIHMQRNRLLKYKFILLYILFITFASYSVANSKQLSKSPFIPDDILNKFEDLPKPCSLPI